MVGLTLSDLEDTLSTIDADLEIFELLSIDSLETHVEFVRGSLIGN